MSRAAGGRRRRDWALPAAVYALLFSAFAALGLATAAGGEQFPKYPLAARDLLAGRLDPERAADFSPAYLAVHVALRALFARPDLVLALLQAAAAAATATLLLLLLRGRFGTAAALAGTAVLALERGFLVYQGVAEPEALLTALLIATVYAIGRGTARGDVVAGFCFGLALLTRGSLAFLLPLLPWYYRRTRVGAPWVAPAARFLVPACGALGLLAAGNAGFAGRFAPFAANPGTVFFEGNNADSPGRSASYPLLVDAVAHGVPEASDYQHQAYRLVARRGTGAALDVAGVNRYWSGKALAFLSEHPAHAARLAALKARLFLHVHRRHDVAQARRLDRRLDHAGIPAVPLWVLSSLGVLGLARGLRRGREDLAPAALILAQLVVVVVFYASERQRAAVVPLLVYVAAVGVERLARLGPRRAAPASAALLVSGYALFGAPLDLVHFERELAADFGELGAAAAAARDARRAGRAAEAGAAAARMISLSADIEGIPRPANLPVSRAQLLHESAALARARATSRGGFLDEYRLALLEREGGELERARERLRRLERRWRWYYRAPYARFDPRYQMGRVAEAAGDRSAAIAWYADAAARGPDSPPALAHLYALTGKEEHLARLRRIWGDLDGEYLVGRAFFDLGDYARAARHLSAVAEALPEARIGLVYAAAALGRLGEFERGVALYLRALEAREDPVLLEEHIVPLFEGWAASRPAEPRAGYWHGVVLRQFGRFEEALAVQRRVRLAAPGDAAVQEEIARLEQALAVSSRG